MFDLFFMKLPFDVKLKSVKKCDHEIIFTVECIYLGHNNYLEGHKYTAMVLRIQFQLNFNLIQDHFVIFKGCYLCPEDNNISEVTKINISCQVCQKNIYVAKNDKMVTLSLLAMKGIFFHFAAINYFNKSFSQRNVGVGSTGSTSSDFGKVSFFLDLCPN